MTSELLAPDMKVLMNHIYEFKKGVRKMVLYTLNKRYAACAEERLQSNGISYMACPVGGDNVNIFFGRKECLDAVRLIVTKPLYELSPEEDFILGTMLGYDLCVQCERFCRRKGRSCTGRGDCMDN